MESSITKVDMAPTMRRIRQVRPYLIHPDTKQVFGFYQVLVSWADGTKKYFSSEEEANAFVEKRAVNMTSLNTEIPEGVHDAMKIHDSYKKEDAGNTDELLPSSDEVDVLLTGYNEKDKISLIKKVRELTSKGLTESKDLVTNVPSKIMELVSKDVAENAKKELELAGGVVEIK